MTPAPSPRPLVMGVLNVTPDSFSDGGQFDTFERAVAHGIAMATDGADVIDVGGESSRPGAEPVPLDVELARVVPVVEALAAAPAVTANHVRISVDTVKPEVALAAAAAGATLVNDITASLWEVAAATGAGWVAMHMRGEPRTMQDDPRYADVIDEVRSFLVERTRLALRAGVDEVWIDPGIGFGKTIAHNLSLLRHLGELVDAAATAGATGLVVGTSRKRFLGLLAADPDQAALPTTATATATATPAVAPVEDRIAGSLATAAAALVAGAGMVRVHDVPATVQLARLYGPAA